MNAPGSRLRQIGWFALLAICVAAFAALSFNVSAVKSEVLLAERQIIRLEREMLMLETEFQTRASQRQLARWNAVELGYKAPRADQYLDAESQLASLGLPAGPDAPAPIRVARTEMAAADKRPDEMVSPISGERVTLVSAQAQEDAAAAFTDAFGEFLIDASPIRSANAQSGVVSGSDAIVLASEAGQ